MKLSRVTITGADDSIDPKELAALSDEFGFVEWGVLFSSSKSGVPRYPSRAWLKTLWKESIMLDLSAHLCGKLVRDLVLNGDFTWARDYGTLPEAFRRVQLNFHGQFHKAVPGFTSALREHKEKEFIFQHDGVNDASILAFTSDPSVRVAPLFDRSGGEGILPKEWPKPIHEYCGYAGGLGPDNLRDQLLEIGKVTGDTRIWIDAETGVRSADDRQFDLLKVRKFLGIAREFVS